MQLPYSDITMTIHVKSLISLSLKCANRVFVHCADFAAISLQHISSGLLNMKKRNTNTILFISDLTVVLLLHSASLVLFSTGKD